MKACCVLLLVGVLVTFSFAQQPTTGRLWIYFNGTGILTQHWAFVVMPGFRYEFAKNDAQNSDTKKVYFYELLTGPVYSVRTGSFTIKLPVWYYYMGFPVAATDDYFYSHNIEFLPIFEYRFDKMCITSRTIFHNTVYASVYETSDLRKGYGLVIRQLIKGEYRLNPHVSVMVGVEPFWGIVEDSEATVHALGYWESGFRMNRLYAGIGIQPAPQFTISPQYVFETTYGSEGELSGINHYLHVVITWILRM